MAADAAGLDPALLDREVGSFAIDSREVLPGSLFFALSQPEYMANGFNGEFADSTVFAPGALAAGALACVVRKDRLIEHERLLGAFRDRLVLVDDAIVALQNLAHGVFENWGGPVVAITGSAGKTTAKELTSHVLEIGGHKVLKNIKNYNNGLGHPLTVLRLAADDSYDVAVLEMGMSTPLNEIARLCRITPPDAAVVLNVLPVHVEHLGSVENVASAKGEIVAGMKFGGTAILNADDRRVMAMAGMSSGPVVSFGIDNPADVSADRLAADGFRGSSFRLVTPRGEADVKFPLNGRHNVSNALAAAAVGVSFGMDANAIAAALSTVSAPPQRGEVIEFKAGFSVVNDSYNSNPEALKSMITTLAGIREAGKLIVIAGEMLELGPLADSIHRETGEWISAAGVDVLVGVRGLAASMVEGAKAAGIDEARFASDSETAGEIVADLVGPGDVILIKGSRGVRTERALEKLLERFEAGDKAHAVG